MGRNSHNGYANESEVRKNQATGAPDGSVGGAELDGVQGHYRPVHRKAQCAHDDPDQNCIPHHIASQESRGPGHEALLQVC